MQPWTFLRKSIQRCYPTSSDARVSATVGAYSIGHDLRIGNLSGQTFRAAASSP